MSLPLTRPLPDEYHPYYARYIDPLRTDDARSLLEKRCAATLAMLEGLDEKGALHRYAPGKWTVKEVIGHVIDTERVMAYRALCFGRGDMTALPGLDENVFVSFSNADRHALTAIRADLLAVRSATLTLLESLDEEALLRGGDANGHRMTVRALFWNIAGHEIHHESILRQRYGLGAPATTARG